ncbi:MAG: M24 family metallopeptidase [Nanoarchaeota archaeon]
MRIKKLQKKLMDSKIDYLVLSSLSKHDLNIDYLLGESINHCVLLVPKKGNCKILVPQMEYDYAKRILGRNVYKFQKGFGEDIGRLLSRQRIDTLGINKDFMNVREFEAIKKNLHKKIADCKDIIMQLRGVKEEKESRIIKKACKHCDKVFDELIKNIKKLNKESDVSSFLVNKAKEFGESAFTPVVASGKNSGYVHYAGDNKKIGKGFMLIDFGVRYKNYNSDMTRTIYVGNPKKEDLLLYNFLLKIQKDAIKMVRPGINGKEIDEFVRKALEKYEKNYTHSLGHGVGLEIHEYPYVSNKRNCRLEEGMTLTIEPGIYFPGKKGIRIEDTVLVTKKGAKVLTKTPKELVVIN